MKKRFNQIYLQLVNSFQSQDQFFNWSLGVSTLTVLLILITFWIVFPHLPLKIPLYYSRPWGESQLVGRGEFLILPVAVILISLLNFVIFWQLHPSQVVLKRSLMLTTIFIDIIILVTSLKILFIFI